MSAAVLFAAALSGSCTNTTITFTPPSGHGHACSRFAAATAADGSRIPPSVTSTTVPRRCLPSTGRSIASSLPAAKRASEAALSPPGCEALCIATHVAALEVPISDTTSGRPVPPMTSTPMRTSSSPLFSAKVDLITSFFTKSCCSSKSSALMEALPSITNTRSWLPVHLIDDVVLRSSHSQSLQGSCSVRSSRPGQTPSLEA
mmetsp:Transcript_6058/g.16323  ORF Transcript_6058/g.16323 Transcript_6058/m.16323 type:complete len:203 (-) Transcript_6058:950-1558(-)